IDEAAAVGSRVERPAEAVLDEPRLDPSFGQLPQLLHAEAVGLWTGSCVQLESPDQLLGQTAARTFCDDSGTGADLRAGGVVGSGLAIFLDAHIAQPDASNRAIGVEDIVGCSESREDIHSQALSLLCEPGGQQTQ